MPPIIVAASAFAPDTEVGARGQDALVPILKDVRADGIEIRRELFGERETGLAMDRLKEAVANSGLLAVYSAPVEMWGADGTWNEREMETAYDEAQRLGAFLLKTSLGRFDPARSDLEALRRLIERGRIVVAVENDQTEYGGTVEALSHYFRACRERNIPAKMTFDIGNWHWTGEDPLEAAERFSEHVGYIHCKHAEKRDGAWIGLPLPAESNARWREVLAALPRDVPLAIEYPIDGENLRESTKREIDKLRQAAYR